MAGINCPGGNSRGEGNSEEGDPINQTVRFAVDWYGYSPNEVRCPGFTLDSGGTLRCIQSGGHGVCLHERLWKFRAISGGSASIREFLGSTQTRE